MKLPRSIANSIVIAGAVLFGWWIFQKSPAPSVKSTSTTEAVTPEPSTSPGAQELNAPQALSASPTTTTAELGPATKAQVQILHEILASKNDNDPRMDRDLKILTTEAKQAFRQEYKTLPTERRNDRGTVVFLIGRNIDSKEDLNFLGEVLNEPPCKSISDCSRTELGGSNRDHDDHQTGMAVTLAYPQLVTIHSLKNYLKKNPDSALANQAKDLLAQAAHSTIPEVVKAAEGTPN
ncbi:MAG: hypothetical protein ACM3MG_07695 [Bacillota bacterium]